MIQPLIALAEEESTDTQEVLPARIVKILTALDIISGTDGSSKFDAAKDLNRGEFASYIVRFLGLKNTVEKGDTGFSDVSSDYANSGDIAVVAKAGIMSGYDDGSFRPEESITYQQCVKVIVSALGYDLYAMQKGGYPAGYMVIAAEKSITDKIKGSLDMQVTHGIVAQLLYNALEVDMVEQTGYGTDSQYIIQKDKSVLTEKLKVNKEEGIIKSNGITALNGKKQVLSDEVLINNEIYKIGSTKADALLGYDVEFYYKEDKTSGDKNILYVEPKEGKNKLLDIKSDNLISYANHQYTYYTDSQKSDTDKADVSAKVDVIYDGKSILDNYEPNNFSEKNFKPTVGSIRLLDADDDEVYDTLFITSYMTLIVDDIDKKEKLIISKKDVTRNVKLEDDSKQIDYLITDVDGNPITFEDLKEWDTLLVAKSLDGEYIRIVQSNNKIDGKISEVQTTSDGNTPEKIVVGENEYDISKDFIGAKNEINPENQGSFYIDGMGNIAYFDKKSEEELEYGYLTKLHLENGGVDKRLDMRVLSTEGSFVDLRTADKVEVDGNDIKSNPNGIIPLFNDPNTLKFKPQLIKYRLNDNGEINKLLTLRGGSLKYYHAGLYSNMKYWSISSSFECKVPVDSQAVVFNIPAPNVAIDPNANLSETGDYKVSKKGALMNNWKYNNFEAITSDVNSDRADAILLWNNNPIAPLADQPVALVDKITAAINDDGEKVSKIHMLYMGAESDKYGLETDTFNKAVLEKTSANAPALQRGDVIRWGADLKGDITKVYLIYDASARTFSGGNISDSMDSQNRAVYGIVASKDENLIKVYRDRQDIPSDIDVLGQCDSNAEYYAYKKFTIYVYDEQLGKVYIGTADDIVDFSHVIIQTKNGNPDYLIVHKY